MDVVIALTHTTSIILPEMIEHPVFSQKKIDLGLWNHVVTVLAAVVDVSALSSAEKQKLVARGCGAVRQRVARIKFVKKGFRHLCCRAGTDPSAADDSEDHGESTVCSSSIRLPTSLLSRREISVLQTNSEDHGESTVAVHPKGCRHLCCRAETDPSAADDSEDHGESTVAVHQ